MTGLLSAALAGVVLVVPEQEREVYEQAVREVWPAARVDVRASPAQESHFAVVAGELVWRTAAGVATRAVDSPSAAVVLMRSWSAAPELAPIVAAPTPEVAAVSSRREEPADLPRRGREVDALRVGAGVRAGLPWRLATFGTVATVGIREGAWIVDSVLVGGRYADEQPFSEVTTFSGDLRVRRVVRHRTSGPWSVDLSLGPGLGVQRRSLGYRTDRTTRLVGVASLGVELSTHHRVAGLSLGLEAVAGAGLTGRAWLAPLLLF